MLTLDDFTHLPHIEPFLARLVADRAGLVIVAGLDPRPVSPTAAGAPAAATATGDSFLPSGRAAIWRILMRQMLEAHPGRRAIVVTRSAGAMRVPRALQKRVVVSPVAEDESYAEAIAHAAGRRPGLLAVDQVTADNVSTLLEVARSGLPVLSQLDTVFRGAEVARYLLDMGVRPDLLRGLTWVLTVQRLPTLCVHCRAPAPPTAEQQAGWTRRYPQLGQALEGGTYYDAAGCRRCRNSGREGEITAFDAWQAEAAETLLDQPSQFPLEAYMLGLAAQGHLPVEDVSRFEFDRLRRTYTLLTSSERARTEAKATLERRLAELEASNRVLQHKTEALISLEGLSQVLIGSTDLAELAGQLCRNARNLCGADRSILYYLRPDEDVAEVLAVNGWDPAVIGRPLPAGEVFTGLDVEPTPGDQWPPGVPREPTDRTALALRAGLRVPLLAHDRPVGLMVVHTSQRGGFEPGAVALLQAFGNQAALAIQRAGLIGRLQEKITELEAAQAELVQKERLEREMELARQVQQSVLPRVFPLVPGYSIAARSEAARWVGGDFYDVILLDAGRIGLVIGDVSDKGMPAALHMAQTQSLLRAEARHQAIAGGGAAPSPAAMLRNVHRLLLDLGRFDMFVTVFCAVLDTTPRRLTYARAGHDRPLLLRGGEILSLGGQGTLLGFEGLDDLHLSEEEVTLQRGDRLVLYTDGLTDAFSPAGRAFGLERLKGVLHAGAALPPNELCDNVYAELAAHQGENDQFDDMTLLIVAIDS
ncbi:MAG: SpoIIE family protein phosphatase [Anaerolineae bacterium]|jgi:serine phosphatase RsbU (regulator of sigma subunit)